MKDTIDVISCAHLDWIFDLCRRRAIHLQLITSGCPYSLEHLTDQTQTIPWDTFLDLVSRTGRFFDEDGLREIGRHSWKSPRLMVHASLGRVMFTPFDQFLSMYGTGGYCARHFPIETTTSQLSDTQIDIWLKPKHDLAISKAFYTIFAGQIENLTTAIGLPRSRVTMKFRGRSAKYSVTIHKTSLPVSVFRQLNRWLNASRMIRREFSGIQERLENQASDYQRSFSDRESTLNRLSQKLGFFEIAGDQLPNIVWTMTPGGDAIFITAIARQLGYQQNEITLKNIVSPIQIKALAKLVDSVLQSSIPDDKALLDIRAPSMELEAKHKLGHNIRLVVQVTPDHQEKESSDTRHLAICVATDVTDRHRLLDALDWQTKNLQAISDLSMDAIFTLGQDEQIIAANPAAYAIFGYQSPELIGKHVTDLLPQSLENSHYGIRKDRSALPLQIITPHEKLTQSINKIYVVRDMTSSTLFQKKKQSLERQIQALQKTDSIGQLASGIVHDFNNLLVAILGLTDLALKSATKEALNERLGDIRKIGELGKDMTQRLLNFSRKKETSLKIKDSNETIKGSMTVISRLMPESIKVELLIHETPIYLLADHTQIEQILINLAINARDAMPNGGTIQIRTNNIPGDKESQTHGAGQLLLEVCDTGTGMDQQTQQRIFEPLYTSKPEGQGTGLGLSVVASIIEHHQGTINVKSALGIGTTFQVLLPAISPQRKALAADSSATVPRCSETILIVENNPKDRNLARLILAGAGYNILEESNGANAVATYLDNAESIDLILLDVVLPKMGGVEAAEKISTQYPNVNIIFTSGYPEGNQQTKSAIKTGKPVIQKPFGVDLLRSKIRAALDNKSNKESRTGQRR